MSPSTSARNAATAGVAVAACAACCAGPIIGFLAAAGLLSALGAALFGIVGLLVLVPVGIWLAARRRRRLAACAVPEDAAAVVLGRRS